jgi:prepilin-type N-terminal cleavage/methylation domain-containing protein
MVDKTLGSNRKEILWKGSKMFNKRGFTLVELLIVVLILAALAAIAVPRMVASADKAKVNACHTNIDLINTQIELYRAQNGTAPTLATLFADPNSFPDGEVKCPFGIPYTLGPNGHVDVTNHAH